MAFIDATIARSWQRARARESGQSHQNHWLGCVGFDERPPLRRGPSSKPVILRNEEPLTLSGEEGGAQLPFARNPRRLRPPKIRGSSFLRMTARAAAPPSPTFDALPWRESAVCAAFPSSRLGAFGSQVRLLAKPSHHTTESEVSVATAGTADEAVRREQIVAGADVPRRAPHHPECPTAAISIENRPSLPCFRAIHFLAIPVLAPLPDVALMSYKPNLLSLNRPTGDVRGKVSS